MKKQIRLLLLLLAAAVALLTVPAFAEETTGVTETDTTGSSSFASFSYTATLANGTNNNGADTVTIKAGNMYLLLVTKQELSAGAVTAKSIQYIDQISATAADETHGYVSLAGWIPRNYNGGYAYVTGTGISTPILLGQVKAHGMLGDVNSANGVNATDAMLVMQKIAVLTTFTPEQSMLADVNGQNGITASDAMMILQKVALLRDENYDPIT